MANMPTALRSNKVPQITAWFWIIKVLTTGFGESFSDFLNHSFRSAPFVVVGVAAAVTLACAIAQFRAARYNPWTYWGLVTMIAIFGTMLADALRTVGLTLPESTLLFAALLSAVFAAWYASERTLSIHTINTPRREFFYWSVVMCTFILGTVVGDLTAGVLGMGYLPSALFFGVAIAIPALAHRFLGLGSVAAFWSAYVVTRPLGASVADWMGSSHHDGLGWGTGLVSCLWVISIAIAVAASIKFVSRPARSKPDTDQREERDQLGILHADPRS